MSLKLNILKSKRRSSNDHQINPRCTSCPAYKTARGSSICLAGQSRLGTHKKLVVFTDYPDFFSNLASKPYSLEAGKILDWLFARMSVDSNDVAYEYTLRCYPGKSLPSKKSDRGSWIEECSQYRFATLAKLKPKAIATLGQVSLEAFTGKTQLGPNIGRNIRAWEPVVRDYAEHVWVGYSLTYILLYPSDTPSVFRVLFQAALEAGLNPKIDPTVPPFHWTNTAT